MKPQRSRASSFASHPLALLAAALAVGILITHFFAIPFAPLLICAAIESVLAVWAVATRRMAVATVAVILATLVAGTALGMVERRGPRQNGIKGLIEFGTIAAAEPVELTGVLERQPENAPESFYLTLRVEKIRSKNVERAASGVVELLAPVRDARVRQEYESLELRYGARLRVMTNLERSDNFRNPGVSSFTEYLDRKGYDATGIVKSPLLIERLDDARIFLPLYLLCRWRQKLEKEISETFSPETASVLDAAVLGNRNNLTRTTAERFRSGGTFHILVIAGLHISFIGGLVFLIVRRFTRNRFWQFVFSAGALWAYAIAVGAQLPVVRASLMFTLVILAPVVSRQASSLNVVGGAGLLLLVVRPSDLFDPAFQLTFLSVLAIVVLAAPLLGKLTRIGEWQPTRETPFPPSCARWLRSWCEAFCWSERKWRHEMADANYSYQLLKSPIAVRLERYHLQRPLRYAATAVIVCASVQVGLLPALILYFHRLSPASIVLNIFVGLLMAFLGAVALCALVAVHISPPLGAPLVALANALNWLMVHSVDLFARIGVTSVRLPGYTGWPAAVYGLYYVPLALLVLALASWNPLAGPLAGPFVWPLTFRGPPRPKSATTTIAIVLQMTLLVVLVAHPLSASARDGKLRIDFLDVGQGDAALVTMPDGTTLLIDGGGRPNFLGKKAGSGIDPPTTADDEYEPSFERDTRSVGEAVVSEYLWWRGLDRIDYILATHADADHIDGLNDVARNFKVRSALVARTPDGDPEYVRFAKTLAERGIPLTVIGAGDVLHFGSASSEVTATVLWPPLTNDKTARSGNNDSIVLRLQYGERAILMTGDVEKEGEAAILAMKNDLRSDVVKVGHHGSRTSSTAAFVGASKPNLAVISVGLTSIFGHPNKEVVERWRASGASVITTGRFGTITVSSDGKDLQVESFVHE
jgi:competence protein ComEC